MNNSVSSSFLSVSAHALILSPTPDVVEEDLTIDIQNEVGKNMTVRHTSLQTTITCVVPVFLCIFFLFPQLPHHDCSSFGGSRKSYVAGSRLLRRAALLRECVTRCAIPR